MIESIKGVRNPLTIIAIFAGLAEISGTGILPFISEPNQATYIWFLIVFPLVLVILFFITLNFNQKVLYSPSDFRDEENYMKLFEPGSAALKFLKIEAELADEAEEEQPPQLQNGSKEEPKAVSAKDVLTDLIKNKPRARYELAESLVIDRLSREFNVQPQRDVAVRNSSTPLMFDALFQQPNGVTVAEVKYFSKKIYMPRIREAIRQIAAALHALPNSARRNARAILAIAHEMPEGVAEDAKRELQAMVTKLTLPVEIRMFSMPSLLSESDFSTRLSEPDYEYILTRPYSEQVAWDDRLAAQETED